jgi:hypothetical protein
MAGLATTRARRETAIIFIRMDSLLYYAAEVQRMGATADASQRNNPSPLGMLLSRLVAVRGLVTLRQTFVRSPHGGDRRCRGVEDDQWGSSPLDLAVKLHCLSRVFAGVFMDCFEKRNPTAIANSQIGRPNSAATPTT